MTTASGNKKVSASGRKKVGPTAEEPERWGQARKSFITPEKEGLQLTPSARRALERQRAEAKHRGGLTPTTPGTPRRHKRAPKLEGPPREQVVRVLAYVTWLLQEGRDGEAKKYWAEWKQELLEKSGFAPPEMTPSEAANSGIVLQASVSGPELSRAIREIAMGGADVVVDVGEGNYSPLLGKEIASHIDFGAVQDAMYADRPDWVTAATAWISGKEVPTDLDILFASASSRRALPYRKLMDIMQKGLWKPGEVPKMAIKYDIVGYLTYRRRIDKILQDIPLFAENAARAVRGLLDVQFYRAGAVWVRRLHKAYASLEPLIIDPSQRPPWEPSGGFTRARKGWQWEIIDEWAGDFWDAVDRNAKVPIVLDQRGTRYKFKFTATIPTPKAQEVPPPVLDEFFKKLYTEVDGVLHVAAESVFDLQTSPAQGEAYDLIRSALRITPSAPVDTSEEIPF